MSNQQIYNSPEWEKLREQRLEIDGQKCKNCQRTKEQSGGLEVHHWIYEWQKGDKIDIEDCVTLCWECHEALTNIKRKILYESKPKVETKDIKRLTPTTKVKGNINGLSNIEVQDYGRQTPINAQRTAGEPAEQILEGDKEGIGKKK